MIEDARGEIVATLDHLELENLINADLDMLGGNNGMTPVTLYGVPVSAIKNEEDARWLLVRDEHVPTLQGMRYRYPNHLIINEAYVFEWKPVAAGGYTARALGPAGKRAIEL